MTLNEFKDWALSQGSIGKYNDGQYVGQCVSLVNQYCYRVLNVPAGAWGNAKDWADDSNPNRQFFDKVSSPQAGDIGVMGANFGGGVGHIFVYLTPTTILEQNGRTPLRVTTGAAYANPIAILRRKGTAQGGNVATVLGEMDVNEYFVALLGRPNTGDGNSFIGADALQAFYEIRRSPEGVAYRAKVEKLLAGGTTPAQYEEVTQLYRKV